MLGILEPSEIETLLQNIQPGRIGCTDGKDIYIVPVNYVFEGKSILCHSYEGQKTEMMRQWPEVCFEIEDIKDFQNWKSVIIHGLFEEIKDIAGIIKAREKLTESALQAKAILSSLPPAEHVLSHRAINTTSAFYRIHIREVSGRFEQTA